MVMLLSRMKDAVRLAVLTPGRAEEFHKKHYAICYTITC